MAIQDRKAVARVVALTLLALAIWALAKYGNAGPPVLGAEAPAISFSADRAYATLGRVLGPERPHPISSDENRAVRRRILAEFAALGVRTSTYRAFACNAWRGFSFIPCATVSDILAEVVPGKGKAIILLAHYDSVPAGPGASDDESGVATVLEVARALRARGGTSLHPVFAVLTDGEEAGLLGAQAFLENPALKARVGAVINVEARGTRGRSLLFQTSPGDGRLIDLYAGSVPFYATSSLYAEIYRLLPNDTDLTLFISQGFVAFNFAFSENVADYHTSLDRRENLSMKTLQEQGDNMLGVTTSLEKARYADLAGANDIYLDLFGAVLPRLPESWALPLALVSLLLLAAAAWRARVAPMRGRDWVSALLLPPALLVVCALAGLVLHVLAQAISAQPDPSYAYPIALREGLALGVVAATLSVARMAEPRLAALSVWLWFALFAVATAALAPGLSPYFLFPALAAAAAGLAIVVAPEAIDGWRAEAIFAPAVVLALSIWLGLVASGETLLGLKLHPLFTIPAAFAAMTLIPLANARAMSRGAWLACIAASIGGALVATIIAGLQPAFSRTVAQRLSIRYVEEAARAGWALDANAPLPPSLSAAADFAKTPRPALPEPFAPTYNAPAGAARFVPPGGEIVSDDATPQGRRISVGLDGAPETSAMILVVPRAARLRTIDIGGQHLAAPADNDTDTLLACLSRDCGQLRLTMTLASHASFALHFAEERYGLPPFAAKIVAARPKTAIPSQNGDITVLANTLKIPTR